MESQAPHSGQLQQQQFSSSSHAQQIHQHQAAMQQATSANSTLPKKLKSKQQSSTTQLSGANTNTAQSSSNTYKITNFHLAASAQLSSQGFPSGSQDNTRSHQQFNQQEPSSPTAVYPLFSNQHYQQQLQQQQSSINQRIFSAGKTPSSANPIYPSAGHTKGNRSIMTNPEQEQAMHQQLGSDLGGGQNNHLYQPKGANTLVGNSKTSKDSDTVWYGSIAKDSASSIAFADQIPLPQQQQNTSLAKHSKKAQQSAKPTCTSQLFNDERRAQTSLKLGGLSSPTTTTMMSAHGQNHHHQLINKSGGVTRGLQSATGLKHIKSPRMGLGRRTKDLTGLLSSDHQRMGGGKGLLSPKRTVVSTMAHQSTTKTKQARAKSKSSSQSNLHGKTATTSHSHSTANQHPSHKLNKVTSQKALVSRQKVAPICARPSSTYKKTPVKPRDAQVVVEMSGDMNSTTIQAPISTSTMVNASRRKFISTPRNSNNFMAQIQATKTSLIQRQLSNKLLSPVATTNRKNQATAPVTSPQRMESSSAQTLIEAKTNQSLQSRPTTQTKQTMHTKAFSMPKGQYSQNNTGVTVETVVVNSSIPHGQSKLHARVESALSSTLQGIPLSQQDSLSIASSSKQTTVLNKLSAASSNVFLKSTGLHMQTPSLTSYKGPTGTTTTNIATAGNKDQKAALLTNASATSLLIKAPTQLAMASHHKTTHSDKIPKLHLQDRPKTTMLVQMQQNQSVTKFQSNQSRQQNQPNRVLSPNAEQLLTQSTESYANQSNKTNNQAVAKKPSAATMSRLGIQHQRSSGDFTLQTYRHTSQSSQGLINSVRSSAGLHCLDPNRGGMPSRSSESKKALTQARFSTTSKGAKSVKKPAKTNSESVKNVFGCRKSSKKTLVQHNVMTGNENQHTFSDEGTDSNRSGKTHIIDEVLHQQKTEAYRELQRQGQSILNQYGILGQNAQSQQVVNDGTSSMGQIMEQEEHDVSIEKCASKEDNAIMDDNTNSMLPPTQKQQHRKFSVNTTAANNRVAPSIKNNNYMSSGALITAQQAQQPHNLRTLTNRAKTTANLQDLRSVMSQGAGEPATHFANRKKSNDTVLQMHYNTGAQGEKSSGVHQRKSSLAMLLKPSGSVATITKNQQQKQSTQTNQVAKNNDLDTQTDQQTVAPGAKGLISESLQNSYLTGSGSMAGQSHKWMCSSKSAKNMMTSCSLGPKSELRQTEQANAENTIKIMPSTQKPNLGQLVDKKASTAKATPSTYPPKVVNSTSVDAQSIEEGHQMAALNTDQQGLTPRPGFEKPHEEQKETEPDHPVYVFGPKKIKTEDVTKPGQTATDSSMLRPILESFKSTLVDYTESMNENQITKLTLEQSREMLFNACKSGDLRTIRRMSQIKSIGLNLVNFNSLKDPQGNAPLHIACIGGHADIAELLIRKMNARIDLLNNFGETALHLACSQGHKSVIERLLLARASTHIRDSISGNTPLHVLALANHQRNQVTTVVSDTVRQTMESCHPAISKLGGLKSDNDSHTDFVDEQLVTEDFVVPETGLNPRSSLIELILPFAEESKAITNNDGMLPWQLAQCDQIVELLRPSQAVIEEVLEETKTERDQSSSTIPVTASHVQGQKDQGRNSVMTRNHSQNNIVVPLHPNQNNLVEVKQVSEAEIANIFTFYNKSSEHPMQHQVSTKEANRDANKLFTFQDSMTNEQIQSLQDVGVATGTLGAVLEQNQDMASEIYQTTSSRQSNRTNQQHQQRQKGQQQANMMIEEEKKNRKDFLDEDIEQIDNFIRKASNDMNEYAPRDGYGTQGSHQRTKELTAGDHLQKQYLQRLSEFEGSNGPEPAQQHKLMYLSELRPREDYSNDRKTSKKHVDTPQLRSESGGRKSNNHLNAYSSSQQHKSGVLAPHHSNAKPVGPFGQKPVKQHYSPNKKPAAKIGAKQNKTATQTTQMAGLNNLTQDSSQKSTTHQAKKQGSQHTIKLSKVKTVQYLRSHTSTQQMTQNWSTAKLKVTDLTSLDSTQGVAQQPGFKTTKSKVPGHASAMSKSGGTNSQRATLQNKLQRPAQPQTALDLKQKVDKQAGLLVEAMQQRVASSKNLLDPQQRRQQQQRIGPHQFVAHQLLGTGSFGEVFLVERKADKKLLAMKVLSKKKIKQQNLKKYAITERNVMCSMGEHPFIVQLRYAFQTREHLFLISDYCPGGDLSQYLEIEGCFSEDKARLYVQEILLGIEALHKQNIIFRDLKPDNVIIDKSGHAMLTDFGLSRENVRRGEIGAKSFCGSYAYLAPEMLKKNGHGKAVDWYLLGVILFEMVTGLPPYYADDKDQLFKNIMKDTIDMRKVRSEANISDDCIDLLQKLLEKDPARRIGTKKGGLEIRQHPFFKDTDWEAVFNKSIPMPDPYLANMAMEIIRSQPYLVAGHPHTVGDVCPREHRSYLQGWSFAQPNQVLSESQVSDSEKLFTKPEQELAADQSKSSQKQQANQ